VRDSISGGLGGSIATMICQPLDVLRTRLIGQGEPKHYDNLKKAVILMYRENGIRTFYRGIIITFKCNIVLIWGHLDWVCLPFDDIWLVQ
jgi:hypothetical protein